MDAFYFGEKGKQLIGFYHPAASQIEKNTGIVVCNPIGHEHAKSYSALRTLCIRLAEQGNHVLIFDYYATGDSSGDSKDASILQWRSDIQRACLELKEISGCEHIMLIGMRFGALLALLACEDTPVSRLLMLYPVIDGKQYMEELKDMQRRMLISEKRFYFNENSITETRDEFLGHPFSKGLQDEIEKQFFDFHARLPVGEVYMLCGAETARVGMEQMAKETNLTLKISRAQEEVSWSDIDAIEDKIIINKTIPAIVELTR